MSVTVCAMHRRGAGAVPVGAPGRSVGLSVGGRAGERASARPAWLCGRAASFVRVAQPWWKEMRLQVRGSGTISISSNFDAFYTYRTRFASNKEALNAHAHHAPLLSRKLSRLTSTLTMTLTQSRGAASRFQNAPSL